MNQALLFFENIVVWAIILVALFCYAVLIELCFLTKKNTHWQNKVGNWNGNLQTLLGTLPLLGLLGTISGLLETFFFMTIDSGIDTSSLMSSGIADAMFTTQIGLLLVVPGWLLQTFLMSQLRAYMIKKYREPTCAPH